jgi:hypothetical protein
LISSMGSTSAGSDTGPQGACIALAESYWKLSTIRPITISPSTPPRTKMVRSGGSCSSGPYGHFTCVFPRAPVLNASPPVVCRLANRWPRAGVQPGCAGRLDIERLSDSPRGCGCSREPSGWALRRTHSDVLGCPRKGRRRLRGRSLNGRSRCRWPATVGGDSAVTRVPGSGRVWRGRPPRRIPTNLRRAARSYHQGKYFQSGSQPRGIIVDIVDRPIRRPARTEQPERGPLGCPRPS